MILGMSIANFTLLHVIISIAGIITGIVAVGEMTVGRRLESWTPAFLVTTILTSVTGFMFHQCGDFIRFGQSFHEPYRYQG